MSPVNVTTTEHYHLNRVAELYAHDKLSTPGLERAIEHVLRGGYLDDQLRFRSPLMDHVRRTRKQRNCPHDGDLIDVSGFDPSGDPTIICHKCGATVS